MKGTCVIFSCDTCGHREKVASSEYNKTLTATQPSLKTLSGKTIVYKPVPDSFSCPQCGGNMFLENCTVEEPEEGFKIVKPVYESIEEVNEEDQRLKEAQDYTRRFEQALTILKGNVEVNLKHLERMEGHTLWEGKVFHTDTADRPRIALVNVLASLCSHAYKWAPDYAADLCFRLLEEVNYHDEAEQVAQLLHCWHHRKAP